MATKNTMSQHELSVRLGARQAEAEAYRKAKARGEREDKACEIADQAYDHYIDSNLYGTMNLIQSVTYRAIEGTDHEELREVREYCSGPVTLATVVDACRGANCRATMFDEQGFACGSCDENGEWILN
jgi:hypothetical protein